MDVWELDMQDYASIQRFASRVDGLPRLDAAVLNAGISPSDYVRSPKGWESTLQVNVLSTASLGLLLMPKLRPTVESHLSVVTSEAHKWLEASDFPVGGNPLTTVNTDERWNPSSAEREIEIARHVRLAGACFPRKRSDSRHGHMPWRMQV